MKSILKIYWRYVFMACQLVIFVVFINFVVCLGYFFNQMLKLNETKAADVRMGQYRTLANELMQTEDGYEMSSDGIAILQENNCAFLLLLDENGRLLWDWQKPEEVSEQFSAGEIAAFSKWYLKDYPVGVWRYGEGGLLVFAYPKDSVVRYNWYWKRSDLEISIKYIQVFVLFNVILVFALALLFGYRFYRSLKPVGEGIDALAEGKSVYLKEKGMTQYLKEKINQTSRLLETQQRELARRDTARTEWIAGVSHDIRTPLSLIAGYADEMASNSALPERIRQNAAVIRAQSFQIKKLIADLNLTSKLTYHMQPLRREEYVPAGWLRQTVAVMLNGGEIPTRCGIELQIGAELERMRLCGDVQLLTRALQNLLGNCVRHNPEGCRICLSAQKAEEGFCFCVRDSGRGIPMAVQRIVLEEDGERRKEPPSGSHDQRPHVMGLRVVKQIACAHGGRLWFEEEGRAVWMSVKDMK